MGKSRPPLVKAGLQKLLDGGIARFLQEARITTTVTVNNPLGDQLVETNYEIFEDVIAKVLINAWEWRRWRCSSR